MTRPKFIADAIEAGEAELAERERTAEEARVAAEIAERRRKLEQEAIDRADAERWFASEMPEMIRLATAEGKRSLRLDRWKSAACALVCSENGLKVQRVDEDDYDYETGNRCGSHVEWEVSW